MALDISQLLQIFLLVIGAHTTPFDSFDKHTYTFHDDNANYYILNLELKANDGFLEFQHFAGETAAESAKLILAKNKQGKWEYRSFVDPDGQSQEFRTPIIPNSFLSLGEKINFAPWEKESKPLKYTSKKPAPKNQKSINYVYKIEDFTISFTLDNGDLVGLGLDVHNKTFEKAEVFIQRVK